MKKTPLRRYSRGLTRREQLRSNARSLQASGGLTRSAVLQPGVPNSLVRKAQRRVSGMKNRSDETAAFYKDERVPFVRVMLLRYPICEMQHAQIEEKPPECWSRTRVVHETLTRARQSRKPADQYLVPMRADADATEDEQHDIWVQNRRQFLVLCDPCHDWIHTHPKAASATVIHREGEPIRLLRRSLSDN